MCKEDLILLKLDEVLKMSALSAKKALTIDDVSLLTGLSKSHIYMLTSKKMIPFYKPNGKFIYFDKQEIEEWMLSCRVETTTESEQNALRHCQ